MKLASVVATLVAIAPKATGAANISDLREHQQERNGKRSHHTTEYDGGSNKRRTTLRRGRGLEDEMSIPAVMSMQDRRLDDIGSLPLAEAAFSVEFAVEDPGKGPKPKQKSNAAKARKLRNEDIVINRRRLTEDAEDVGSLPLAEAAFSIEFNAEETGKARKLRPKDNQPLTEAAFSVEFAVEDPGEGPKPKQKSNAAKARKLRNEDIVINRRRLTEDAEDVGSLPLAEAAFSIEFNAEKTGKARKLRPKDDQPLTEAAFSVEFAVEDPGEGPKPKQKSNAAKARKLRNEDIVINRRRLTDDAEAVGSLPLAEAAFSIEFNAEETGKARKLRPKDDQPLTEAAFSVDFAVEDHGEGPKPKQKSSAAKARKLHV